MSTSMNPVDSSKEGAEIAGTTSKQYSTFFVEGLFFGVEVLRVQEVIRYQEMTRVPLAPEVIEGLINLRGQIVTAIDMRVRLGLPCRPAGRTPLNMVVRSEDGVVSLLVDEIGDVVEVQNDTFELPPDNVRGVTRELITGVHKLKDHLLLLMDTERAIDLDITGNPLAAAA
jgi:purine-binding chemotaxis protein CheW